MQSNFYNNAIFKINYFVIHGTCNIIAAIIIHYIELVNNNYSKM